AVHRMWRARAAPAVARGGGARSLNPSLPRARSGRYPLREDQALAWLRARHPRHARWRSRCRCVPAAYRRKETKPGRGSRLRALPSEAWRGAQFFPAASKSRPRAGMFPPRWQAADPRCQCCTRCASRRSVFLLFDGFQPDVGEDRRFELRRHVRRYAEPYVCRIFDPDIFNRAKLIQIAAGLACIHRESAALPYDAQTRRSVNIDERLIGALVRDAAKLEGCETVAVRHRIGVCGA